VPIAVVVAVAAGAPIGAAFGRRDAAMLLRSSGIPDGPCATAPMPADLLIRLERTECYGTCPAYAVTLDASGAVEFDGRQFVDTKGHASDHISPAAVQALYDRIERACFARMKDDYTWPVTDNPSADVTVIGGGKKKMVHHYPAGSGPLRKADASKTPCWAPAALSEIEDEIDRVAGTARWIGNAPRE
jgi:hypothetical protein